MEDLNLLDSDLSGGAADGSGPSVITLTPQMVGVDNSSTS
jgi:hypothetical protein